MFSLIVLMRLQKLCRGNFKPFRVENSGKPHKLVPEDACFSASSGFSLRILAENRFSAARAANSALRRICSGIVAVILVQ
jgi:hypothetical protein